MNSMQDFYNESRDYSNYSGSDLTGSNYSADELNYFAQGGADAPSQLLEPLNRTLTFVVQNNANPVSQLTAILFAGNVPPPSQTTLEPTGITVAVQETGGVVGTSHDIVRQESLANPFVIQGLRYFFPNTVQLSNAFTIAKQDIQGKTTSYIWQATNYVSPTNFNSLIVDAPDFGVVVDGRTRIEVPLIAGTLVGQSVTASSVTLVFTVKAKVITTNSIFGKGVKEMAQAPRMTGNPLADIQLSEQRRLS